MLWLFSGPLQQVLLQLLEHPSFKPRPKPVSEGDSPFEPCVVAER
jgi:hypothetical protein